MPRKKAAGTQRGPHDDLEIIEFTDGYGETVLMPKRKRYFFGAAGRRYRLQLLGQSDWRDQRTGQIIKGRNKAIQFENGVYGPVNDLETAKAVYQAKSFKQGLIWDIDTKAAIARETNYQALKQAVVGNAEDKRRLFEELKAEMEGAAGG